MRFVVVRGLNIDRMSQCREGCDCLVYTGPAFDTPSSSGGSMWTSDRLGSNLAIGFGSVGGVAAGRWLVFDLCSDVE
jgi:hypothetical protein